MLAGFAVGWLAGWLVFWVLVSYVDKAALNALCKEGCFQAPHAPSDFSRVEMIGSAHSYHDHR